MDSGLYEVDIGSTADQSTPRNRSQLGRETLFWDGVGVFAQETGSCPRQALGSSPRKVFGR